MANRIFQIFFAGTIVEPAIPNAKPKENHETGHRKYAV
jgi:hypothetical protein